jgi:hypothetical protein
MIKEIHMQKLFVVIAVVVLASAGLVQANGIAWNSAAGWCNYANGSTPLTGGANGSIGCFAQLLWVGPNGLVDSAYNTGTGVGSSDDVVIDYNFMGFGVGGADGFFGANSLTEGGNIQSNRDYFIRVWSAPSANFASGLVPTSSTNRYGNSATWTYHSVLPTFDTFDGSSVADINTTLSPIPEPAMLGLGIVGLISLRLFGRKRA